MPSLQIGALTFDAMNGTVDLPGAGLQAFQRPGRDCHRARHIGLRAAESRVETIKFVATAAAAKTAREGYKAIRGTAVTVYDAMGVQVDNVTVLDVTITEQRPVSWNSVTGAAGVKLAAAWTLLAGKQ